MKTKTNPLSVKNIEKYASNIRKQFNIPYDSEFPILDILEEYSMKGYFTLQFLEDNNPDLEVDTPAKYCPLDNFIYVKESVLEELENNIYRANFTLAHEFFHFYQIKVLKQDFDFVEDCECYCDLEWQANEFAAQILIPSKYLEENFYDDDYENRFKVSSECVITRKLYYKKRKNKKIN